MSNRLPTRPNLEHLRSQAKDLLSQLKAGDAEALRAYNEHLPESERTKPSLSQSQLIVARQHGYPSWPKLVHHVEGLNALDGVWRFVTLEVEGNAMPPHAMDNSALIIDGDSFQMVSDGAAYQGNCAIDIEASPQTIDIHFIEGPEAGKTSLGIYTLEEDRLTICLGFTGVPRPTTFETAAGSGLALETLRRDATREIPVFPAQEPVPAADPETVAEFGEVSPAMELLQGLWTPIKVIRDGVELPAFFLTSGTRVMTGAQILISFGGKPFIEALTRIDESAEPASVDYLLTAGKQKGQLQYGVMKLEDGKLFTAFGDPSRPRPTEFESTPGSGITLSIWERKG